jgi:hypothetical protein
MHRHLRDQAKGRTNMNYSGIKMKIATSKITFYALTLTALAGLFTNSLQAAPAKSTIESKTIYRQVMKDGSVVFSDAGQAGAVKTAEIRYRSTSGPDAVKVANLHKEHWNRQSEGFNQRQAQRDNEFERARRERLQMQYIAQASQYEQGWYAPRFVYGVGPRFPDPTHTPMVIQNGPATFIGSGFASASASSAVTFSRR